MNQVGSSSNTKYHLAELFTCAFCFIKFSQCDNTTFNSATNITTIEIVHSSLTPHLSRTIGW